MKDQLAKIGIDVALKTMDDATFHDLRMKRAYETFTHRRAITAYDPDAILMQEYKSGAPYNWANVNDPELDRLIDLQSREQDTNKRKDRGTGNHCNIELGRLLEGLGAAREKLRPACGELRRREVRRRLAGTMSTGGEAAMAEPIYQVVWPLGRRRFGAVQVSAPVPDLKGKTVCEVWDRQFRGNEVFPIIREKLLQKFPGLRFVGHEAFGNIHGPDEKEVLEALPERLYREGCDVVIVGIGA